MLFQKLCNNTQLLVACVIVTSCTTKTGVNNPLLQEWTGPYGGLPAFDQIDIGDVQDAMVTAMDMSLSEIEMISNNPDEPTFENTIEEMERSGAALERAFCYYGILRSNISTPEFREIDVALAPQFADYYAKITQNQRLFSRLQIIYQRSQETPLEDDQQRVIELMYKDFEMNGAALDSISKVRYANINRELSSLYTTFSNNVLHDEENYNTYLTEDQLDGLSDGYIKSAARIATAKGQEGKYAITNTRSSMDPFLTFSTNRELRKTVWTNYYSRGDNNDEYDNKDIIAKILELRRERIELLGYPDYPTWRLQNRMAKNPANALKLMETVWPAAIARVDEEVADMQAIADQNGNDITIEPWDYRFYAEKVRRAKYDLDSEEVKQYLQLDNLTDAMHYVAGRLFNYEFNPVPEGSVPVFHKDVKVWDVTDKTTGNHIGLWYLDPYARDGKRSGAWATTYRSHTTFDGKTNVLASNNSNFVKPAPGEPLLVSWDDAITFFHEFGHALHFFSSEVRYPTLNGGVRDYTEFQSQLLERWLLTDEVIENYLVHAETGEPIPDALVTKIKNAATFNQGFATTEYLASALIDMKIHLADP
ncbi:MAG: M3 family metallopeptidase, partial [Bacteroidota bacterium]|nr:M3 family metallopeptidase [Bacteroidota bacterium]